MQSKQKQNIIFIRMFPDEDVNEGLKKVCKKFDVKNAVVLSGLGQLKNVKLGYFKEKGDYAAEDFSTPHELLSLTGNIICQDDEYLLHLHAVLGDEQKRTIGGHLISGFVEVTGEIVLLKTNIDAKREIDEKTDLKALVLE